MTGRILEAILSGTALVQHEFSELEEFLVPFVHYFLYGNLHRVQHSVYFLAHDHDTREQMAHDAREWALQHCSSGQFWNLVLSS